MAVRNKKHTCKPHAFQDRKYGKTKRVYTFMRGKEGWRCTVCSHEES